MAGDPYWNNVVLAMHMDGTNGSTTFTDVKGKTVTAVGNASISTAQSKFNGASGYFDGAGDYLTVPASTDFAFGTGDFTVELWYRPISTSTFAALFYTGAYDTSQFSLRVSDTGKVQTYIHNGGNAYGLQAGATSLSVNQWNHIAVVSQSGVIKAYLNGTLETSAANSISIASTGSIYIGTQFVTGSPTFSPNGYIDDLRITKGVARYTTTFTPPTSAFLDNGIHISGTVKGDEGAFAERTVRAYRRSDGALSGSTSSNGTTGVFNVSALDNTPHYVICLPSSGAENALIFDNITPI